MSVISCMGKGLPSTAAPLEVLTPHPHQALKPGCQQFLPTPSMHRDPRQMVSIVPCTVAGPSGTGHSAARERGQQDAWVGRGFVCGPAKGERLVQTSVVQGDAGLEAYVLATSSRST